MSELNELMSLCKNSVTVRVNPNRDYYQTVEEYVLDEEIDVDKIIGRDIFNKMIETNTVVEVRAYPRTAISCYTVYHYDVDLAISKMINILKNE